PPADLAPRPRDRPDHRRALARRARGRRHAGRRRGRRRPRAHARGLDRHGAGARPRADGGDPDARRPDHERELHRLPDPDGARHAAGGQRADRGPGARRALRREGRRGAADGRLDRRRRLGAPRRHRAPARPGAGAAGRHRRPHLLSSSAAPPASSRMPTTRVHSRAIRSTPNQPNRSIAAATTRLPVITSPIAAATPIRGAANVIERTMKAERIPPSHIQTGSWAAWPTPWTLRRATSSTTIPVAPATRVEKPTASTVPTRSPRRPSTAAWIDPANPAETDITTASAVPPDTGQPY